MGNKSEKMLGGPSQPVKIGPFNPLGSHQRQALSDAAAFSPGGQPKGGWQMRVQALTQSVSYTLDGTAPTAAIGFTLTAGDSAIVITLGSNSQPRFIAIAAGAILQYQWGE